MKIQTYKEKETLKERGTKRYQERLVEEQEAEEEIKQYKHEKEEDEFTARERHSSKEVLRKE